MEAYRAACYHNCNLATYIHMPIVEKYENFVPFLFMPLYRYQTKNKNGKASPQNLNGNDG